MASLESLEEVLQDELKDIYDAEKQLTKALPKMAKNATSEELKQAFEEHLRQTEQHVERLEQVFEQLDMPARGKKCEAMKGLIEEGQDMMKEVNDDATCDAVMIAAAQKVEHYEIASYGTVRTWANVLGKSDVAALLEETLEEEKEADQKLTGIADNLVNPAAAKQDGEEEEDEESGRRDRASARAGSRATMSRSHRQAAADRKRR